jgi:hypothetical protein
MARGKFNKRGGGKRLDAQSADEIEQRNQRLAEFEENRVQRRIDAEEEENGGADDGGEKKENHTTKKESSGGGGDASKETAPKSAVETPKPEGPPVVVTSAEDHKKNMAKLEFVRRRREKAEARRKVEEEAELAQEIEQKAMFSQAAKEVNDDDGGKKKKKGKSKEIDKLTKIEIKKMKPALMKDGKCFFGFLFSYNGNKVKNHLKSGMQLVSHFCLFSFYCFVSFIYIFYSIKRKKSGYSGQQKRTYDTTH